MFHLLQALNQVAGDLPRRSQAADSRTESTDTGRASAGVLRMEFALTVPHNLPGHCAWNSPQRSLGMALMAPDTSTSLLRRLVRQDGAAWKLAYAYYWDLILKWCRLSGCSDADAEEIAQESMTRVLQQLESFQHPGMMSSLRIPIQKFFEEEPFHYGLLSISERRIVLRRDSCCGVGEEVRHSALDLFQADLAAPRQTDPDFVCGSRSRHLLFG